MSSGALPASRRYYFALPRLWAFLRGGSADRSEQNSAEAYVGGVAVFLVSYALLLAQFRAGLALAVVLLFATWLAWLTLLYLNALIVLVLRRAGMVQLFSPRRVQNVIIGVETTACAIALTTHRGWSLIGWTWLALAAANTVAALALRLAAKPHA